MPPHDASQKSGQQQQSRQQRQPRRQPTAPPISNYTLSSVCPACTAPTVRRACKVRCDRCGFMWDCSEL